ncbi:hypothetical protein ACSNOI_20250 [Actinomadura kijaniata]|uniref:hypothetical protein n=1 Tax=Actinomadura kijaniata TaxID=46161 RepID=UPI003F1AE69E
MSCDHLICARCSHPVSEGRCPTCRAAHAELHGHGSIPPALVLAGLVALLFALLVLRQLTL